MFDHIFENRDRKITNIIKLSDYIGRSLRENVEVFSIDDTESKVTFVTESGKILAGSYDFNDTVTLNNIQVEDGELFEDNKRFDDFVDYKITDFIQNVFEEDFAEAETSFSKVLQLWESRVKFSSVKEKLYEKSLKFNGSNRILESEEFQKMVEIAPQIVVFLKENSNLINIPEIKNMVKLSSSVSKAFDLPKITYDSLHESSYTIPEGINHSIYEMICKQELVRKELVESKNSFNLVWLNNKKVSTLASLIYERDEKAIVKALVEAVCEVPYLALATKRQITETLTSNLELNEAVKVNIKDIKSFSSALFEYKKPLKQLFVAMLNEKYGISVQNLRDIPTFKSLLNTQVLIFEALAKLSPKNSLQKEVLSETAAMLKTKNGVETIDVNHFIELLFEKADYTNILNEPPLLEKVSIKETFSNIESIEELIVTILEKRTKKAEKDYDGDGEVESGPDEHKGSVDKAIKKEKRKDSEDEVKEDAEHGYDSDGNSLKPKDKKKKKEKIKEDDTEVAVDTEEEEPVEEKQKEKDVPSSDEIMASFKDFEDILNSINFEDLDLGGEEKEEKKDKTDKTGSQKQQPEVGSPEEEAQ